MSFPVEEHKKIFLLKNGFSPCFLGIVCLKNEGSFSGKYDFQEFKASLFFFFYKNACSVLSFYNSLLQVYKEWFTVRY